MDEFVAPVNMFEQFRTMFLLMLVFLGARFLWRMYRLIATDAPRSEIVSRVSQLAGVLMFVAWSWYGVQFALVGGMACIALAFFIRNKQVRHY